MIPEKRLEYLKMMEDKIDTGNYKDPYNEYNLNENKLIAEIVLSTGISLRETKDLLKVLLDSGKIKYVLSEEDYIDISKIHTGITIAQRSNILTIRDIINEHNKKIGESVPIYAVMEAARARGIEESKIEEAIDRMKRVGLIFEPKKGFLIKK